MIIVIINNNINPLSCLSEFDDMLLGASISGSGSGYPDGSPCQEDGILSLFQRWGLNPSAVSPDMYFKKTNFRLAWQGHLDPERMPSVFFFFTAH